MGHAEPKVRIVASRATKDGRVHVIAPGDSIVTRTAVEAAAIRRAMRAILRDMPQGARSRESIRAKLQAVRQRG